MTQVPKPIFKRRKPKQKDRTKINAKEYQKALDYWGESCFCGNTRVQMHHVAFRSSGASGRWRNLHPLCMAHHQNAHDDAGYRRHLEVIHTRHFGSNYHKDEYTLYEEGLIDEPTVEKLEYYFNTQEEL